LSEDILNKMCNYIISWLNHTKEGHPRQENDLILFDRLWLYLSGTIKKLQKQVEPLSEQEKDIIKMIKYEGTLYRIHKKYKNGKNHYGVHQTEHYVSWTKTNNFNDLYWLNKNMNFLTLTAKTSPELFAIDLIGFTDLINKYCDPGFSIGSPAIFREQEVVFPIKYATIIDMTPNKWID